MKEDSKKSENVRLFMTVIAITILIFIVTNSTRMLKKPVNLSVAEEGSLSYEEPTTGYILRDEIVMQGENYKNGMVPIVSDNQKAAKEEPIFRYYSNGEEKVLSDISELEKEINEILETTDLKIFTTDILSLEKSIEASIDNIYGLNELSKIQENCKLIENYMSKKTDITGNQSPEGSYIKNLTNKRDELKSRLERDSEIIKAPISGIVSYRTDGLEEILKTDNFDYLNKELLDSFELKVGAVTPISSEKGKVIDNFHCYIATCMNTEKSHDAKVGDKVSLRFSSSKEINAEIVKIIKNDTSDDEDIIIVFEIFDSVEDLIEYRKISMDIIWWKYAGLKISNSAIIEENDKTYVERNRAGYQEKIEVFIMRQNDTYSIIAYTDEHFEKLGFSKEEMSNIKRISLYDEVILH
ncbi:MAG: hypothetical protein HFJ46_05965 [Clostridia bacterium]|nr:hypothetical protein [Clostridia bacterium]